ncbi:MAG: hypothetical protein GX811_09990 [Lentisphaerae bacterium]|nr:hypothetical protein [Lentisphaerota bacterium]
MSKTIVVDKTGRNNSFTSINEAAKTAQPGDTILVKPGIYREHVAIERGGEKGAPLTFQAEKPGTVYLRGSEVWNPVWTPMPGTKRVFTAPMPQELFKNERVNIFRCKLCVWSKDKKKDSRPSDVSLLSPYSADFREAAKDRELGDITKLMPYSLGQFFYKGYELPQSQTEAEVRRTPGSWFLSNDGETITLHFPIGGLPSDGNLEITVRDRVFAPARRGLEYVTLRGFIFEHCGNQGPFPQNGMVSIRSGSNWVIEDNIIQNAKTIGLDCGNEYWIHDQIPYTVEEDYKEFKPCNVIIRNNTFRRNGLAGISGIVNIDFRIENNVFEENNSLSLANDYECTWEEQGAIKLHGSNRTLIAGNLIRNNAAHGIWIDCGHDESRISRNFIYGNEGSGIYMEVGSKKVIIDNNILACTHPFFPQDGQGKGAGYAISHSEHVTFAHNLVVDNYGPGASVAPDVPRNEHKVTGHRIFNNIFLRNHGCVEMTPENEIAFDNISDSNVFINPPPFKFISTLHKNEPEKFREYALSKLNDPADKEAVEKAPLNSFTPELWTKITGMEQNSIYLNELNFNSKIKPYEPSIRIRTDFVSTLLTAKCKPIPGITHDFTGVEFDEAKILPGPFQDLQDGDNYYLLFALTAGV